MDKDLMFSEGERTIIISALDYARDYYHSVRGADPKVQEALNFTYSAKKRIKHRDNRMLANELVAIKLALELIIDDANELRVPKNDEGRVATEQLFARIVSYCDAHIPM